MSGVVVSEKKLWIDLNPLTTGWQYSSTQKVDDLSRLTAYVNIVKGSADSVDFKFQFSYDGITWFDPESLALIKNTLTDYQKRMSVFLADHYVRMGIKGNGVSVANSLARVDYVLSLNSFGAGGEEVSIAANPANPITVIPAIADIHLVNSGTPSVANLGISFDSTVLDLSKNSNFGVQLDLINTDAIGVLSLQVSNTGVAGTWNDVTFDDGSNSILFNLVDRHDSLDISDISMKYARFHYVRTSGDGKLDIQIHLKG
jgi:hypothetical protein